MNRRSLLLAAFLAFVPAAVPAADATQSLTQGEIRRVDKDAKKLTIRHERIANLDMDAMTMVFQVADPAMLQQVKAGDRVRFRAESIGGALTVTRIEASR